MFKCLYAFIIRHYQIKPPATLPWLTSHLFVLMRVSHIVIVSPLVTVYNPGLWLVQIGSRDPNAGLWLANVFLFQLRPRADGECHLDCFSFCLRLRLPPYYGNTGLWLVIIWSRDTNTVLWLVNPSIHLSQLLLLSSGPALLSVRGDL